jgi:hypothetical protein
MDKLKMTRMLRSQSLNSLHHNQTSKETQKRFMFLIQLLTKQLLMLTEELLSTIKVINLKKALTGQTLNGHHLNQTLLVLQRKYMYLIQLLTNQERIPHPTLETEELVSMLKPNLRLRRKAPTGQIPNGLLPNQTLLELQKEFTFLIQ